MDEYLYKQSVDRDSHGQLCSIFYYLEKKYGRKETINIIQSIAMDIYRPLIDKIKKNGLLEYEKHFRQIMELEGGKFKIMRNKNSLVINLENCPAVEPARNHMDRRNMKMPDIYCRLTTGVVNDIIALEAGYKFKLDYDQQNGKCVQKFWKE